MLKNLIDITYLSNFIKIHTKKERIILKAVHELLGQTSDIVLCDILKLHPQFTNCLANKRLKFTKEMFGKTDKNDNTHNSFLCLTEGVFSIHL